MRDAGKSCKSKTYARAQVGSKLETMEQLNKLTYVRFVCCIDDELRPELGGGGSGTSGDAKDGKTRKRPLEAEGR